MPPRWRTTCRPQAASAERPASRRGPAARAGAAGPRRPRPPVAAISARPRTPSRRRCIAAARAVAAGRRPREAARLADPDRRTADDRPAAQRAVAAAAGGARRAASRRRPTSRRGRHARRALHVLPSGADAGLGDRADAARGRRPDDGRDRARVPRAPRRRWRSGSAARSSGSRPRASPFRMPAPDERPRGWRTVLHVLYLIFNEGYASSAGGELQRAELSDEAIRLARMVQRLLPEDGEVAGLLALMLLHRRPPSRPDGRGRRAVPLAEQDRSLWDRALHRRRDRAVTRAIGEGPLGEYQLQAAIAALHDRAATADETDWPQILALYGLLEQLTDNPVVTLNRAVATAMADGPAGRARRPRPGGRAARGPLPAARRARPPAGDGGRYGRRSSRDSAPPPAARRTYVSSAI